MDWIEAYKTYFTKENVISGTEKKKQGVIDDPTELMTLKLDDEELLALSKRYINNKLSGELDKIRKRNLSYWRGNPEFVTSLYENDTPLVDNVIFEATETLLPLITKKNPEPVVAAIDGSDESSEMAGEVRKILIDLADSLRLKLVGKKVTRHWLTSRVGIAKFSWDAITNEMTVNSVRPDKIILDKNGIINDQLKYTGEFIGEYKDEIASTLILRFPKKAKEIKEKCDGKLGTEMRYLEWWTCDYLFYVMDDIVLGKYRNPHWNYEGTETRVNYLGEDVEVKVKGSNHFPEPTMPYIFLSVFSTDEGPCDDTTLIEQTIGLQNIVTKRNWQIDFNADNTNSGMKFSGDFFNEDQARVAQKRLRKGEGVLVPTGDVNAAVQRDIAPPLPPFIYQSLQDARSRTMAIFGVQGSTPTGVASQETARGKILAKTSDDSRVGGGITEYLEQFYDHAFNWMLQMAYVYYDQSKIASVVGEDGASQFVQLRSSDLRNIKLQVSVKEGSLIPEDPLTKANQATDLRAAGAISLLDLHKRLGDPNPIKTATNAILEQQNPAALYPDLAGQQPQMPGMPGEQPQGSMPQAPNTPGVPPDMGGEQMGGDILSQVPIQ